MSTNEKIDWQVEQERFMNLAYTRCERAARRAFKKKWHSRKVDDAIQECLSKMWYQWRCCLEKGKDPAEMIGPLIHWAILHVKYNRRIAGRAPCFDVFDYRAKMTRQHLDAQGKASPADRSDPENGWIDWSLESGDDPAEMIAALDQVGLSIEQFLAA